MNFKSFNFNNIWKLAFIFIFIGILYSSIFQSRYSFNPLIILIFVFLSIIVLSLLYKKLNNKFSNLSNKSTYIFCFIIITLMIILQFVIGYLVRTNPSWDLGIVIKSAKEMVKYGHSTTQAGYYIQAPNNIVITLIIFMGIKFFNLFHIHNINLITLAINICFMQLAIFLTFKIIKRLFNNFTACCSLLLMAFFIPFYAYSTICYTDTTSMFIPVAFLLTFMNLKNANNKKSKIAYSILLGFLCFISFGLKVTALIILIAYSIISIFNKTILQTLKYISIAFITFIILYSSYVFMINKTNIINMKYKDTQVVPFTHFIMMGMTGSGAFSAEEWQYTFSFSDKNSRKEANINKIRERLSAYKVQGYIKFLSQKATNQTWGNGTYDFETVLNSYNIDKNIMHEFLLNDGKYWTPISYYCQIYHFVILILILISFIYSLTHEHDKISNYIDICQLSILGLLLFLFIWETRSRYMLNYIPIYIIVSISGLKYLSNNITHIFKVLFIKNNSK